MRQAQVVAFGLLAAMIVLPCAAQTKMKGDTESASAKQSAVASDPVSSFKRIVRKFETFFAGGPRKAIERQNFPDSPNGTIVAVLEFSVRDVAYDVQETKSLVSPYLGTITFKLVERQNGSCGDVKRWGWTTAEAAMSAINQSECFKWFPFEDKPTTYNTTLSFAFQDGQWVFKDARDHLRTDSLPLFLALFGNSEESSRIEFSEPEAKKLNAAWRDLVRN